MFRRKRYVNLGCGSCFSNDWENYDLVPASDEVKPIDLSADLPFPDARIDAIYASHVLEHLPRSKVPAFLTDCHRVLRKDGILRLVVPDLENVALNYIAYLDQAESRERSALAGHEWMTLELLDQMARQVSGGYMGRLWRSRPLEARQLIGERMGDEALRWIESMDAHYANGGVPLIKDEVYAHDNRDPAEVAQFRALGEIHLWMYDRISLALLMEEAGFEGVKKMTATESGIRKFSTFNLDAHPDGRTRKPDSLFMEGTRIGS